jgi:hypothetical protein
MESSSGREPFWQRCLETISEGSFEPGSQSSEQNLESELDLPWASARGRDLPEVRIRRLRERTEEGRIAAECHGVRKDPCHLTSLSLRPEEP